MVPPVAGASASAADSSRPGCGQPAAVNAEAALRLLLESLGRAGELAGPLLREHGLRLGLTGELLGLHLPVLGLRRLGTAGVQHRGDTAGALHQHVAPGVRRDPALGPDAHQGLLIHPRVFHCRLDGRGRTAR
ncbi:hypothetical protein [Streptomyces sp. NWU339]|uniref:hypothetical protein n=1 Tax=Streptomyces sp. NWU339 TaxID=2185284 RepID=UPI0011B49D45|nr:hypothetical protein [Streptomyces sp. NWU339]